jgi:Domain of unknown function (DUF1929)
MRARNSRHKVWGLLAVGVIGAALLAAVPTVFGGGSKVIPRGLIGDGGRFGFIDVQANHHPSPTDARADAVRWIRCSKTAWRVKHYGMCPSPAAYRRVGIKVSDRRPGVKTQAEGPDVGQWIRRTQIPTLAIHAVVLPTGKVLMFSYPDSRKKPETNYAKAYVWDPVNDPNGTAVKEVDPPPDPGTGLPFNIWCAGQTVLPNGDVLVAGGNLQYDAPTSPYTPFKGHYLLLTFNPFTETWTVQPRMAHGRWYPTLVKLPDGRVLIIGGYDETGQFIAGGTTQQRNTDGEVFTPSPANGGVGTLTKVPNATVFTGLYPHLYLLPGGTNNQGEVVMAGPGAGDSKKLDVGLLGNPVYTSAWNNSDRQPTSLDRQRTWASGVILPYGTGGPRKLMVIGGSASDTNGDATPTTTTLDLSKKGQVGWSWEQSPPANSQHCWPVANPDPANGSGCIGRSHGNTVLLPDGSMVSVGGGRGVFALPGANAEDTLFSDPVYAVELWDPATNTWRVGPSQQDARTYHSTALLLPDGTVMSAGDDRPEHQDPAARTAEIYAPPYLFKGPRPSIAYPRVATTGYNQPFTVNTPDAGSIAKVRLVALGADTHANDMNQRELELAFTPGAGGLTATSPSGPTIAPPGYYMMFVVNAQGVPSPAAMVRLDPAAAGPTYVDAPPAAGGPGSGAAPGAGQAPATGARPAGALAKIRTIKVTAKLWRGKLKITSRLPAGQFSGRVQLFRVDPPKAKKKATAVKAAKKPKFRLTLTTQKSVKRVRKTLSVALPLPKAIRPGALKLQVKVALTGAGAAGKLQGLRNVTVSRVQLAAARRAAAKR